jgi:hypothetical protein
MLLDTVFVLLTAAILLIFDSLVLAVVGADFILGLVMVYYMVAWQVYWLRRAGLIFMYL